MPRDSVPELIIGSDQHDRFGSNYEVQYRHRNDGTEILQRLFAGMAEKGMLPKRTRIQTAQKTFDAQEAQQASGLRVVASPSATRQMLFSTDAAEIAVNVYRAFRARLLDISGQVFPTSEGTECLYGVMLFRGADPVARTSTDDLGEFRLQHVRPGDYHLLLSAENLGIVITPFEVTLC